MAKFVKIDESELPCPMWLYGNVDDLVKNSKPETIGRTVKAIFSGEPGNVENRPLTANEYALYCAFLYWFEQINFRRVIYGSHREK
nr:MAG TPA: hypothetical protein [Caudoviricetes sp.]